MIKRLKRRFIIVNMCILSCVLFSVLATIFILMYNSEIKLSNDLMYSIIDEKNMVKSITDNSIDINDTFSEIYISKLNNSPDNNDNNHAQPDDNDNPWNPIYPEEPNDQNPPQNDINSDHNIEKPEPKISAEHQHPTDTFVTEPLITKKSMENPDNINQSESNENTKPKITNKVFIDGIQPPSISEDYESGITEEVKKTTVSTKSNSSLTTISSSSVRPEFDNTEKPDRKKENEFKPDPFKGKVKRAYIYVEFSNINDISSISYEFFNDSQNDEEVKKAVIQIYNTKKEQGKINIGQNKYRYLFQYDAPKL